MDSFKYVHIISHTHWDREWYLNSKYTNEWLVPFFDSLFKMMEKEPEYKFVLDGQTSMIEDYLDQLRLQGKNTDEYQQKLKKYASEKRLIVGPYYLQPDWQLISEEAAVRNLLIGTKMASELGESMKVGWLLDNFGQISQAPQIHKQFGMFGLFAWRGVEMDPHDLNSEFAWESPDGTVMPCVYFLSSYRNAMRLAEYHDMIKERIENEVNKIFPYATTPNVLLMNGYDQEMVPDDIIPFIQNGRLDFDGFKVIQSTPESYMKAVLSHNPSLKRLKGALYSGRFISVFPGILSSRMYLKIQNDICQKELEKYAEPLQTVLWCNGGEYKDEALLKSWKVLLKNHPHDSICGVSIDDVHTDMEKRFDESYQISNNIVDASVKTLAGNINTQKYPDALFCFVVFNTMMIRRDGIVTLKDEGVKDLILKDGNGNVIPYQKDENNSIKVYLKDIPALGYTLLYALPKNDDKKDVFRAGTALSMDEQGRVIENPFVKVEINADGSLNVFDKLNNKVYSNIAAFEDGADAGDEYNYSYPEKDVVYTSRNKQAEIVFEERGPLRTVIRVKLILDLPEGLSEDGSTRSSKLRQMPVTTWITLEAESPVVKFKTRVQNTVKDHRVRVLFPTDIKSDVSYSETQFDVVERKIVPDSFDNSTIPDGVKRIIIGAREPHPITTFPQRTFAYVCDGEAGAAVFNRGLPEYEVLKERSTIALTLFRAINWITRDDLKTRIGDAGPVICVPEAQCLRTMEFDYAFYPHSASDKDGAVVRLADQFNTDLISAKTGIHEGELHDALEFARLDDNTGSIKVTAVKRSEDGRGIIIRLCNLSSDKVAAKIKFTSPITRVYQCDLSENIISEAEKADESTILFTAEPKRIMTFKVETAIDNKLKAEANAVSWISRNENYDCADFEGFEAVELITEREIKSEEERASALEKEFAKKEKALEEFKANEGLKQDEHDWKKKCNMLQLEVETFRRASLEARLSALLIRKKAIKENILSATDLEKEIKSIEDEIKVIGYKLNEARVTKRVYEYIADVASLSA